MVVAVECIVHLMAVVMKVGDSRIEIVLNRGGMGLRLG